MKKIATLAIAASLATSAAFAGGYEAPEMEAPTFVPAATSSSASGWILPAVLVLLVGAAVLSSDSDNNNITN